MLIPEETLQGLTFETHDYTGPVNKSLKIELSTGEYVKILKNIKKGITTKQAKKFTKNAKSIGLKIFGCFMIGLPGDTKESIRRTFDFAKELNPDMAFFQHAVPFPGTEFYEWCKKNGYLTAKSWDNWLDENGRWQWRWQGTDLTSTQGFWAIGEIET